tara:strand:+ start:1101 stop:1991 length:891 start_codon:yes stop_codon:yes gene_type:complete
MKLTTTTLQNIIQEEIRNIRLEMEKELRNKKIKLPSRIHEGKKSQLLKKAAGGMAKAVGTVGKELAKDLDEPKVKKIMAELEKSLSLDKGATDEERVKAYADLFQKLKGDQQKLKKLGSKEILRGGKNLVGFLSSGGLLLSIANILFGGGWLASFGAGATSIVLGGALYFLLSKLEKLSKFIDAGLGFAGWAVKFLPSGVQGGLAFLKFLVNKIVDLYTKVSSIEDKKELPSGESEIPFADPKDVKLTSGDWPAEYLKEGYHPSMQKNIDNKATRDLLNEYWEVMHELEKRELWQF